VSLYPTLWNKEWPMTFGWYWVFSWWDRNNPIQACLARESGLVRIPITYIVGHHAHYPEDRDLPEYCWKPLCLPPPEVSLFCERGGTFYTHDNRNPCMCGNCKPVHAILQEAGVQPKWQL